MKKIIIIGSGGAGKSTLARDLSEMLDLPVFHLDSMFWSRGWVETPRAEWEEKQKEVLKSEEWIIDGNYGGTMQLRFDACDTIIFLSFPRIICLWRVIKRYFQYRGKTRPDMGDGCQERLSFEFIKWIWDYPKTSLPKVMKKINDLPDGKNIIILKSPKEVQDYCRYITRSARPEVK